MNILRKLWDWLCRLFDDSVRILKREIKARQDDLASITKTELKQMAKTEGKHFFLGGLAAYAKRRYPSLPLQNVVKVGYEDCFEASGIQPLAAFSRCLKSFWSRCAGNYVGSPLVQIDFACM